MQAATAPVYLAILNVHEFSIWLLATAIASYASLTVNGPFYAIMNEITIQSHRSDRAGAAQSYTLGISIIAYLFILSLLFLSISASMPKLHPALPVAILLSTAAINLSYVLFDANFRSAGAFAKGSNVLSGLKLLDWAAAIAAMFLLRDVTLGLLAALVYRIVVTLFAFAAFERSRDYLKIGRYIPGPRTIGTTLYNARGQLLTAASTASSSMGPQIVISAVFPGPTSVYFNVYRTYMRLLASAATTTTAAAWPIFNKLYAEGETRKFENLLKWGLIAGGGLSAVGATALYALAPRLFPLLFKSNVPIIKPWLAMIAVAVVISTLTIAAQSAFVSTNSTSRGVYINFIATLCGVCALYLVSKFVGFQGALIVLVLAELLMFVSISVAAFKLIRQWQGASMAAADS